MTESQKHAEPKKPDTKDYTYCVEGGTLGQGKGAAWGINAAFYVTF